MSVERVKKEAPARKRVNCLRERGVKREAAVVVVERVLDWGFGSEEVMAEGVLRWRNAMSLLRYEARSGIVNAGCSR